MMEVLDILALDGIVVRKVPNTVISRWRVYPDKQGKFRPLGQGEEFTSEAITNPKSGTVHKMVKKTTKNSLNYLITFVIGTGSSITFSTKRCGVGNTIPEAYEDYNNKRGNNE